MFIEVVVAITTQAFAKRLLYYANYLPNRPVDLDKAVKECRRKNPPPDGHAVDPDAFWNDLICGTPSCRKFVEKQRIDNLEELIHRLYAYDTKLETQVLLDENKQLHGNANNDRY